jgi:hypothetical protein
MDDRTWINEIVSPSLSFSYPEERVDDPDGFYKISRKEFEKKTKIALKKITYPHLLPNPAFDNDDAMELLQQRYHESFPQGNIIIGAKIFK